MTTVNVGDVLATKYRVEKVLGIGGMGMVVAATHLELDQRVALKFMLPEAMRSEQATDRFLREAKAAVKLRSEHVCRVLDVGRLDTGAPYIVMEYMEGHDFANTIEERGRLSAVDTVDYVMQALEGLAEAHVNGIVHRDLKPGNLFVTTDNEGLPLVKVLDFGISKSSVAGSATRTGDIMGSPSYMSPEQMTSSKNVDARADIWAMGVILYQALTGTLPFEGDTLPALCVSVMTNEPPSIAALRPDLPAPLVTTIMRCLDKNPDTRYRDVGEFAAALAPFGSASAPASAMSIGRVLRRSAPHVAASSSHGLAAAAASPTPMPGGVTTLQASAGAVSTQAPSSPIRTKLAFAGIGAALAAGILVVAVFRGGGSAGSDKAPGVAPASQPASTVTTVAEPPAPMASPPVTAPVVAPVAAPPVVAAPEPAPPPAAPVTAADPAMTPKPTVRTTRTVRTPKPSSPPVAAQPVPAKPAEVAPATPVKPAEAKPPESKWTRMQHDKSP